MDLVIDIGNTYVKFGVFDDVEMDHAGLCNGIKLDFFRSVRKANNINKVIVSPLVGADSKQLDDLGNEDVLIFSEKTPVPIQNHYLTPETLGRDRLAGIVGAKKLFPGRNCLVIDCGTCITFDFVDIIGNYEGGSIHPGIRMRLKAMHVFTDSLPLVELAGAPSLTGKSTDEALQSGAFNGVLMEIRAVIDAYEEKYDRLAVILTGGDHKILAKPLENRIFVHPDLVLRGLNEILRYNEELKA